MEGTLHYRGVRTSAMDVRMDVRGAVRLGRVGEEAVVRTDNGAIAHMDKQVEIVQEERLRHIWGSKLLSIMRGVQLLQSFPFGHDL